MFYARRWLTRDRGGRVEWVATAVNSGDYLPRLLDRYRREPGQCVSRDALKGNEAWQRHDFTFLTNSTTLASFPLNLTGALDANDRDRSWL